MSDTLPEPAPTHFRETLAPGLTLEVAGHRLDAGRSAWQDWEVWDTPAFGRLYRLDGRSMASEADSFRCHEALIHIAALAQDRPRRALVLGGGDGASCLELLRHDSIESVVLAELDPAVTTLSRRWLHALHLGALDDARVHIRHGDALALVRAADAPRELDLIVFDLTDPDTAAAPLYTSDFFRACRRLLSPQGALCLHLGSPLWQGAQIATLLARLGEVFAQLTPVETQIPLYGGAWWLAVASDTLAPAALPQALVEARIAALASPLRLIDASRYHALLAAPARALP